MQQDTRKPQRVRTVCPKVQVYNIGRRKDYNVNIKYLVYSDIADESVDIWQRNKRFSSYADLFKNTKLSLGKKRSLIGLIFRITLDLILKDIILFNYTFMFPHINGGRIGVYDVSKKTKLITSKGSPRVYHFLICDLNRNYYGQKRVLPFLAKKYYSIMKAKVLNGHTYKRKDD